MDESLLVRNMYVPLMFLYQQKYEVFMVPRTLLLHCNLIFTLTLRSLTFDGPRGVSTAALALNINIQLASSICKQQIDHQLPAGLALRGLVNSYFCHLLTLYPF